MIKLFPESVIKQEEKKCSGCSAQTQAITIDTASSQSAHLFYGIPQGFVPGPVLYTLSLGVCHKQFHITYMPMILNSICLSMCVPRMIFQMP